MTEDISSDDRIVIGLSRDPAWCSPGAWVDLVGEARAALTRLTGEQVVCSEIIGENTALFASGSFAEYLGPPADGGSVVVPSTSVMIHSDGGRVSLPTIEKFEDLGQVCSMLGDIVPPFAFVARSSDGHAVAAGTDVVGLQHVYIGQLDGCAAVSTSSSVLGILDGKALDPDAWGVYSLIGNMLADRSAYAGVSRLRPAEKVTLVAGRLRREVDEVRVPSMGRARPYFASLPEALADGSSALTRIVGALAENEPEAVLELSGGLDSRVLLGFARYCGYDTLRTMTIGEQESADVRLARKIAERECLNASIVPVSLLDDLSPVAVLARVERAASQRDFAADPVSGALYDASESRVPARAQLNGNGGELARGYYFTGQRSRAEASPELLARVLDWRLVSNFRTAPSLLSDDFRDHARTTLLQHSWRQIERCTGGWPSATDQFYLLGRLQPWSGAVFSRRGIDRRVLTPFFHPEFIDWASRIPPERKRNSRTFAALLVGIAPDLARIPLDSGLTPYQLSHPTVSGRYAALRYAGHRAVGKAARRVTRSGRASLGTASIARAVVDAWSTDMPPEFGSVPWLRQETLERVQGGAVRLDTASVAFLVNVLGATRRRGF